MNRNHLPFVWVDPVGAAFGFRSSADGKKPGLPIVILGGDHGDIPLTPETGEQVAKFIVSENVSILLDLSLMRKAEQVRFMTGFSEAIYHLNKSPRHLFVDETDLYAPQRPFPEGMRLLGSLEDIVRRGRIKGLGFTSITQRAAVLNKDLLTQTECLIVLQTTGPQDKKAVKEWVNVHVDDPASKQVIEFERSLPTLQKGQAWVWSPAWLKTFELVQIRRKETFDSSATPKPGQLSKPKVIAEVDLGKLQTQMSAVIEEQKANDPKELRRQVAALKAELQKAHSTATPVIDVDAIVTAAVQKALSEQAKLYGATLQDFSRKIQALCNEQLSLNGIARFAEEYRPQPVKTPETVPTSARARIPVPRQSTPGEKLPIAERKILTVLAQFEQRTKIQVALLSGYAHSGGGFNNALSALRSKGYMEGSEQLRITDAGRQALGSWTPLPQGRELLTYWMQREGKAERTVLRILADEQGPLSKTELADRCGYAESGGGFNNALSRLRTLELISGSREITIAPEMLG